MSFQKSITIKCDGIYLRAKRRCTKSYTVETNSLAVARKLKPEGWTRVGNDIDLCPVHAVVGVRAP